MHYWEIYREETILTDLQAKKKDDVLKELVEPFLTSKLITKAEGAKALELLRKRERTGSTGIGRGVAVPHVKMAGLKQIHAGFGIHRTGVDYKSVDGEPAKLFFLIIRPEEDADEHLRFLQWVSKLARNADFRSFALRVKDAKELQSLLKEMASL